MLLPYSRLFARQMICALSGLSYIMLSFTGQLIADFKLALNNLSFGYVLIRKRETTEKKLLMAKGSSVVLKK